MLFLILETGMMGVFLSLDFFLFYVFWEVMLLPMYFLIGVWGGPRREYAAIKFFLYTLAGSVLMLIAMLMFYFNSAASTLSGNENIFNLLTLAEIAKAGHFDANMQIFAFILLFWLSQLRFIKNSPIELKRHLIVLALGALANGFALATALVSFIGYATF